MKKTYTIALVFCTILTQSSSFADSQSLPLSDQQIKKLQRLFPQANSVPEFQSIPHEHVIWQQAPLDVILPVGKERMISFPTSVDFGYDKSILSDEKLKVQNNAGTLYLTAKSSFRTQRVQVRCGDTGQIILLNLSAKNEASNTPLDVVIASDKGMAGGNTPKIEKEEQDEDALLSKRSITSVTLTRFAAQQLYAPKRLLVQPPDIYRVPMHTAKTIKLILDGSVIAMPLASWRGGDLTVTAVLLRNQLHWPLQLDPRNLCGNWQEATFFPSRNLSAAGSPSDSTTVFLVGNRPFAENLQSYMRGF